jgi:hypothetical protein
MAIVEAETAEINLPEWTEYRKKNGLDPLGMQNSSISLYQTFLPGISNVTLRMRYYGFYAWLCKTYAQRIRSTNPEDWKRFVRRAEALYALIAYKRGGESGVAGIEWAQKTLDAKETDPIDFATAAEPGSKTYYLKQTWGIYGLAYRSQLFEIGILAVTPGHEIPLPSAEIGEPLADAFASAIGDLANPLFDVLHNGRVTRENLDRFAPLAPSEIGSESEEREAYQDVLLTPADAKDEVSLSRRRTILLILKVTELLGREPKPDEVRWILYAGRDQSDGELALGSADLEVQRRRWWVYQANDLCHIAHEALLKFTLDNLADAPTGRPLAQLIPDCVEILLASADEAPESWSAFLELLQPSDNPYSADSPNTKWSLASAIMKGAGRKDESVCPPDTAWKAVVLLATLHRRVRSDEAGIATELGQFDPDAFRSLLSETRFLERHLDDDFHDTLGRIIEERVVRRHLWVALRKFRHQGDYTFLLEMDEGRLRLREKDGPVYTNPRLGPAITFLKDIHLIGADGLTKRGSDIVSGA